MGKRAIDFNDQEGAHNTDGKTLYGEKHDRGETNLHLHGEQQQPYRTDLAQEQQQQQPHQYRQQQQQQQQQQLQQQGQQHDHYPGVIKADDDIEEEKRNETGQRDYQIQQQKDQDEQPCTSGVEDFEKKANRADGKHIRDGGNNEVFEIADTRRTDEKEQERKKWIDEYDEEENKEKDRSVVKNDERGDDQTPKEIILWKEQGQKGDGRPADIPWKEEWKEKRVEIKEPADERPVDIPWKEEWKEKGVEIKEPTEGDGDEKGVSLCVRLMLLTALCATEMCMAFNNGFAILMLQFLGVPLAMVSMSGIIGGVVSTFALPIAGLWVDRGHSPRTRKMIAVLSGVGFVLVGQALIFTAALLRRDQVEGIMDSLNVRAAPHSALVRTPRSIPRGQGDYAFNHPHGNVMLEHSEGIGFETRFDVNSTFNLSSMYNDHGIEKEPLIPMVPLVIILSIMGFAIVDLCADVNVSLTRALVVESVPKFQQMSSLVLATITQSSSGTTAALLGCTDLPEILGSIFHMDNSSATLIFFSCFISSIAVIGLFNVSVASYLLRKNSWSPLLPSMEFEVIKSPDCSDDESSSPSGFRNKCTNTDITLIAEFGSNLKPSAAQFKPQSKIQKKVTELFQKKKKDGSKAHLLSNEHLASNYSTEKRSIATSKKTDIRKQKSPMISPSKEKETAWPAASDMKNETNNTQTRTPTNFENNITKSLPNLENVELCNKPPATNNNNEKQPLIKTIDKTDTFSTLTGSYTNPQDHIYSDTLKAATNQNNPISPTSKANEEPNFEEIDKQRRHIRRKLIITVASSFFAAGSCMTISLYASNALTIGVLHGDPAGLPGTEGRRVYDEGLKDVAMGTFLLFLTLTVVSIAGTKTFEYVGEKKQYVLLHLTVLFSLVLMVTVRREECYFILMVACGAFRSCMYTLPYLLTHALALEEAQLDEMDPRKSKGSYSGKTMTLIGAMLPSHYAILSALMGPLLKLTGDPFVPLYYSIATGTASMAIFSLMPFA